MVKLTFEFNETEVAKAGLTTDELLTEVRAFAKENDIAETSYGVFEKDGVDAVAMLSKLGVETLRKNLDYLKYIKTLNLDDDGDIDDCKESVVEWLMDEDRI